MVTLNKLSALTVKNKKEPGYYSDGGNLYLQISKFRTKSWVFRFVINGKRRDMGLGSIHTISLSEARAKALELRKMLIDGIDPIEHRNSQKQLILHNSNKEQITFKQCAIDYINANKPSWKNKKHIQQWNNTLETYAFPVIGSLAVNTIDLAMILKILEPMWYIKAETANRLRGRIETILDYAKVKGLTKNENPARWKGHLDKILPPKSKVKPVKHQSSLHYSILPEFISALHQKDGISINALEFSILTATRSGEVRGAKWSEIDLNNKMWIIPANRMKAKIEHRIPLSNQAILLLNSLYKFKSCDYVFPSKTNTQLSDMALTSILRKMQYKNSDGENLTQHGFRSTFRDWSGETTNYPREVCEQALAHRLAKGAEAAYQRGDFFEKRRQLMVDWGNYCYSNTNKKSQ